MLPTTVVAQRTVTARLNTSTLPDTTQVTSLIEVRGAIDGNGGITLPDGNIIDWSDATTLEPVNTGGDYWDITFQIPADAELQFKFYSDQAEQAGLGGWEGGNDQHTVPAGTGDVDLGIHYFDKADRSYSWRPFEAKPDSVGVWFRVYMSTKDALCKGYDRTQAMTIGVRGEALAGEVHTGPLDWGSTEVVLTREGDDDAKPGFDLYSGVAYYPKALAGQVQNYKYFIEPDGWEEALDTPSTNRQFTVPATDTTLHWIYFSDSSPTTPTTRLSNVTFTVDVTPLEALGLFSAADGDQLQVRGAFNGWNADNLGDSVLLPQGGEGLHANTIPITSIVGQAVAYKFYIDYDETTFADRFGEEPPNGWEEPFSAPGATREFMFTGEATLDLGVQLFSDIGTENVIPEGNLINLAFRVDMTPALSYAADPFEPNTDLVYVDLGADPLWAFTQDDVDATDKQSLFLTDSDGDLVYTGTLQVTAPTYNALQYTYGYGTEGTGYVDEAGGSAAEGGRRRVRYIVPHTDGSWPSEQVWPVDSFTPTGPLPAEDMLMRATRTLNPGWSLVGLPISASDSSYTALFPNVLASTFFGYNGGYVVPEANVLTQGQGYWLRFEAASDINLIGRPKQTMTIALREGWNMVAGPACTLPVDAVDDVGGVLLPGTLFGFDDTYVSATALDPLQGYWVRASAAGVIVLNCEAASKKEGVADPLMALGEMVVEDARGQQQRLYFGNAFAAMPEGAYTRPPTGPARSLYVAFNGDRYATADDAHMAFKDAVYPLQIQVTRLPEGGDGYRLVVGNEVHPMQRGQHMEIMNETAVRLERGTAEAPQTFVLQPNYPNPFNPSTTFRFALPEANTVSLIVYDLTGRQVATVVEDASFNAGWHAVGFDAGMLASGAYVYRLTAGAFSATRTLTLLK
ncbi:MAG: hypothetical protein RhofKO_08460 [Rhodothermales bacterium]